MTTDMRIPLMAILRGVKPVEVMSHVDVLIEEGYGAVEVPTNSPEWEKSVELAIAGYGSRALIGAGTVVRACHVDMLSKLGAKLMVTPNTDAALIRAGRNHGLLVAAGVATPSEAFEAVNAGAQILKIFPAASYGPDYVRALRTVLPATPMYVVGGITTKNITDYLGAGATGAGIGSEIFRPGQTIADTRRKAIEFRTAYECFSK